MLARALARPSNLLVLDEPTNDLDLETLDLLQELLSSYEGTVLLVSHDRDFLDRVVTSVIHAEGDGKWVEYAGGYSDIAAQQVTETSPAGTGKKLPKQRQSGISRAETSQRRRMTYKDKHALETLPGEIAAMEGRVKTLQDKLGQPDLYEKDTDRFHSLSEELGLLTAKLAEAEERWLELELLKEELEG